MKRFLGFVVAALIAVPAMAGGLDPFGASVHQIDLAEMDVVSNPDAYVSLPRDDSGRAFGDTYDIALLGQSTASAFFLTAAGRVNNQAYDGLAALHGNHVIGATGAVSAAEFEVAGPGPGQITLGVGVFSNNGADLLPAGLTGGGLPINQLRMDMGAAAAGLDQLSPVPSFDIIAAQVVLFIDGAAVFTAPFVAGNGSFAGQLGQTGLADISVITGAAGAGVDEIQFQYIITPEPGTFALLALAGLMGIRRR